MIGPLLISGSLSLLTMLEGRPAEAGAVLQPGVAVVAAALDRGAGDSVVEPEDGLAAVAGEGGAVECGGVGSGGHIVGVAYVCGSTCRVVVVVVVVVVVNVQPIQKGFRVVRCVCGPTCSVVVANVQQIQEGGRVVG